MDSFFLPALYPSYYSFMPFPETALRREETKVVPILGIQNGLLTKTARNRKPKHSHDRHQAQNKALSPSLLVALVALAAPAVLAVLAALSVPAGAFAEAVGQRTSSTSAGYKSWSYVCPVLLNSLLIWKLQISCQSSPVCDLQKDFSLEDVVIRVNGGSRPRPCRQIS